MDTLTKAQRSERMSRVRAKDTKPELTVRAIVHAMGFRYRLHVRGLPGKPDMFSRAEVKSFLSMDVFGIGTENVEIQGGQNRKWTFGNLS